MISRTLLAQVRKQDKQALAQAITLVENGEHLPEVPISSKIRRIGITGPPGVGKSTLISYLTQHLVKKKRKVGILVVDPSSAVSGGALLGDRIRMGSISGHKDVFIRSVASRGTLGGLSKATYGILRLYELFGFDDILIETVGAGQSEVDIAHLAQTVVLVLIPQLGDEIQALKAGIMEHVHIIALNRAEQPAANDMLRGLLGSLEHKGAWTVPVIELKNTFSSGLKDLDDALAKHHKMVDMPAYTKERIQQEAKTIVLSLCNESLSVGTGKDVLTLVKKMKTQLKRDL